MLWFRNIVAGGTTSFVSAFDKISEICEMYEDDINIGSMVVIFLTDGQDSSHANRKMLCDNLRRNIMRSWKKDFVVHTIGFGTGHDFDFLNNLRMIGSSEGAYRFADPHEDEDSLSIKINSLINVIAESVFIPVKIVDSTLNIIGGSNCKYWIDITNKELRGNKCVISINNNEPFEIDIELIEDTPININEIWEEWYGYSIERIADDITDLNKYNISEPNKNELGRELFIRILLSRIRAIKSRLKTESRNYARIESLEETIDHISKGNTIDEKRMNDIKSEGIFTSNKNQPVIKNVKPTKTISYGISNQFRSSNNWVVY